MRPPRAKGNAVPAPGVKSGPKAAVIHAWALCADSATPPRPGPGPRRRRSTRMRSGARPFQVAMVAPLSARPVDGRTAAALGTALFRHGRLQGSGWSAATLAAGGLRVGWRTAARHLRTQEGPGVAAAARRGRTRRRRTDGPAAAAGSRVVRMLDHGDGSRKTAGPHGMRGADENTVGALISSGMSADAGLCCRSHPAQPVGARRPHGPAPRRPWAHAGPRPILRHHSLRASHAATGAAPC